MEAQDIFQIEGLGGEKKLSGEIKVGGAKNAVLKVLASSLLFKDEVSLSDVPQIEDVERSLEILRELGVRVEQNADNLHLITNNIKNLELDSRIAARMRSSIVFTGPLLARFGRVSFPHPGGCVIGRRPIDMFLEGYSKMGARVKLGEDSYEISTDDGKLKGAEIFFKMISVTGTETFILAGLLAEGKTVLKNVAQEPEIESLCRFLISCGAKISGLGTTTLEIEGGELLSGAAKTYKTMPDRIEAGSFIILGALAARDLKITNCEPHHLDALLDVLRLAGVNFEIGPDFVRVFGNEERKFKAVDIKTHEYPGFPTDLQAPMSILLSQAEGQSFIFETIFENRLNYLEAIGRFGADVKILDSHRAIINGPHALAGKEVDSPDLRAGLAYVIAGIIASGQTVVHNIYYIDRGYEQLEKRLAAIGLDIKRRHPA